MWHLSFPVRCALHRHSCSAETKFRDDATCGKHLWGALSTPPACEEPTGPPVACVFALGRVCALAPGFPGGRCRAVVTTLGPGGSDPNNESPGLRCRGMPAQTAGWRGKASDRAAPKRCPPAPTSHSHELQTCLSHRVFQKTIYCLLKSRFPEVLQTPA